MFAVPRPAKRATFSRLLREKLRSDAFRAFLVVFLRANEWEKQNSIINDIMRDVKRHDYHRDLEYFFDHEDLVRMVDLSVDTVLEQLRRAFGDEWENLDADEGRIANMLNFGRLFDFKLWMLLISFMILMRE